MADIISPVAALSDISSAAKVILSENDHALPTYICFFVAGVLGALANLLVRDNALVLPRRISGRLVLGCLGPMLVGGVVGIIADGKISIAALSGYVGSSVLDKFVPFISSQDVSPPCDVKV